MGLPQAKDAAPADGASERGYEALLATLSASALGRGFLAEYARRQRLAETETLLAAMARLEAMVAAQQRPAAAPAEPTPVVAALEEAAPLPVAARLEEAVPVPVAPTSEEVTPGPAADIAPDFSPAGGATPAESAAASIPEVSWLVETSPSPAEPHVEQHEATSAAPDSLPVEPIVAAAPSPLPETLEPTPPRDAYEQLMILTDEERIALFS